MKGLAKKMNNVGKKRMIIYVTVFAGVMMILTTMLFAAQFSVSQEAEQGSGSNFDVIADSNASNGSYIEFTGTGSTTPETGLTVDITEPQSSELSGEFYYRAAVSGSTAVDYVDMYIDNTLVKRDTSDPFVTPVVSTEFSNGEHTLRAVARDSAGNETEATKTVTFSNGDTQPDPDPDPEPEPDPDPEPTPGQNIIWTGNRINDWYSVANSGGAWQVDVTYNGLPAVEQFNPPIDGSTNPGARMNFQGFDDPTSSSPRAHSGSRIMPTEAWYGADILVPEYVDSQDNVFQFKQGNGSTRQHIWNVGWRSIDGELRFIIRTRLNGSTWESSPKDLAILDKKVPINQWFRFEVFRRISTGSDGRYIVNVNGETIWTFSGPTRASNLEPRSAGDNEWVLSHYLGRGFNEESGQNVNRTTSVLFRNATIGIAN